MEEMMQNAFDLCLAVADHIEAEPRRYDQRTWGETWDHCEFADAIYNVPPCGTSACRAGWMVGLHDGMDTLNTVLKSSELGTIEYRALQLLGVKEDSSDTTEYDFRYSVEGLFNGGAIPGNGRTVEHARRGAQGLRDFAHAWRDRLTATPLPAQIDATTLVREFRISLEVTRG